jgi:hypothetical protein
VFSVIERICYSTRRERYATVLGGFANEIK